jgi:uncharacterized membrane protein
MDSARSSVLAYALWWITGIILLIVGRADRNVRYHAAQSTVLFGGISVVALVLNFIANLLTGTWLAVLVQVVIWGVLLFAVVAWVYCLYLAWQGRGSRFDVLLVGDYVTPYAERLAEAVG